MLDEDRAEPLDGTEDRAMDDDGTLLFLLGLAAVVFLVGACRGHVLEAKPDGQLEVELDGGALMLATQRIEHVDVDLGSVEGAVLGVQLPLLAVAVERGLELSLGLVPHGNLADVLLRPGGEEHFVLEAELAVDKVDELEHVLDLLLDVVRLAEDVRVVLLEAAHAGESAEGAAELVAVQYAEVCHAPGELAEGALAEVEHEAVPGAVHGLHSKLLALDVEDEHVLLVVRRVPRDLPQLQVVHVRRDHLLVVALEVLSLDEVDQLVVDPGPVREPEAAARAELVEEEELLLGSDGAMVSLLRLLDPE
mmetsp:Transcript_19999/g.47643  ORF Transcript_19999/g.47643 Transcript_19999/m.47643 type:complete len:307 (+) Transcript_19999:625-1545(+)